MLVADSRTRPNQFARRLFAGLPPRYDQLAEILSLAQNRRWRRAMVDVVTGFSPGLALDVATGSAGVALQIAERTPARVVGLDLSPDMLGAGMAKVGRSGLRDRVSLLLARGEQLPFADGTFDALTFTYLLRYVADPAATVKELARVVRPGGLIASLEFHVPAGPLWHRLWLLYTRLLLPVGGLVTGGREWMRVGRFLGPSISAHYARYPLDWHVGAWRDAGITEVQLRIMSLGGGLVMWGRRDGEGA